MSNSQNRLSDMPGDSTTSSYAQHSRENIRTGKQDKNSRNSSSNAPKAGLLPPRRSSVIGAVGKMKAFGSHRRVSVHGAPNTHGARYSRMTGNVRTSRSSMAGRTRGTGDGNQKDVQVIDDNGIDVTPKPLLPAKSNVQNVQHSGRHSRVSETNYNSERHSSSSYNLHSHPQGMSQRADIPSYSETADLHHEDAFDDQNEDAILPTKKAKEEDVFMLKEAEDVKIDPEEDCEVELTETSTMWMLDVPSLCVSSENATEFKSIEEANERYKKVIKERATSDMFSQAEAQTLIAIHKDREVQCHTSASTSTSVQSTPWDIHDMKKMVSTAVGPEKENSTSVDGDEVEGDNEDGEISKQLMQDLSIKSKGKKTIAQLQGLGEALQIMERAVVQNIYHDKLLIYRDVQPKNSTSMKSSDSDYDSEPSSPQEGISGTKRGINSDVTLEPLWKFKCKATEGRNTSCMAFNTVQSDLLAVGYGQFEFQKQGKGIVAFWSIKNPDYPQWHFETSSGICCLDFSRQHANLLAVGMYDGTVAIYDVRSKSSKPVLESGFSSGKHADPVWKVQWVTKDREEVLASISTDGRVSQWSITKGLECQDLMKLKRVMQRNTNGKTDQAFISRRSSGMSLDFSPTDHTIYIAATEDGSIHKCSYSYAEQYLETYSGHIGPVYNVQWSPFASNLFITCSADWTVRIWSEDNSSDLLSLQSGTEQVNDVQWCKSNSTVFGSVTDGGRLEIWDLATSTLKPVIIHTEDDTINNNNVNYSCLLFSEEAPIVVCGDSQGAVTVLKIKGVKQDMSDKQRADKLLDVLHGTISNQ